MILNGQKDEIREFGTEFEPVYPPHSPIERYQIISTLCSRRLNGIVDLQFIENEHAHKLYVKNVKMIFVSRSEASKIMRVLQRTLTSKRR